MKTVVPNVSLIIPVYNVEQYLPKCLESIAAQTLKGFEVILVDDGSTDRKSCVDLPADFLTLA